MVGVIAFIMIMRLGSGGDLPMRAAEPLNPHGDFIFRVTGTKTCLECHAFSADGSRLLLSDNEAVRALIVRGKGNHGPGRFADCFRCHAGGRLPGEQG